MAATTLTAPSPGSRVSAPASSRTRDEAVPSLGHYLVVGVIVATLVLFIGVAAPIWAAYGNFAAAVGIGGLAAMWGGPCFGLIGGAATHTLRTAH